MIFTVDKPAMIIAMANEVYHVCSKFTEREIKVK